MRSRVRPTQVFFFIGLSLWILGGFIVTITCFQSTISPDILKDNKELAIKVMEAWNPVMLKVIAIWALAGGVLGVVISKLFIARPQNEHFFQAPRPRGMPEMPEFFSGPKTMAEIHAGFQGLALGIIIGVCGTVFILPLLQNDLIVVQGLLIRIIIGVVQTIIVTVPVLPFSLKFIRRKIQRGSVL